jgi:hypothetical protein
MWFVVLEENRTDCLCSISIIDQLFQISHLPISLHVLGLLHIHSLSVSKSQYFSSPVNFFLYLIFLVNLSSVFLLLSTSFSCHLLISFSSSFFLLLRSTNQSINFNLLIPFTCRSLWFGFLSYRPSLHCFHLLVPTTRQFSPSSSSSLLLLRLLWTLSIYSCFSPYFF